MTNNAQIAADVLAAIGGKENVNDLTHCMTRLRFNLKNESVAKDETINGIKGVHENTILYTRIFLVCN